jgi:hypothetical protein
MPILAHAHNWAATPGGYKCTDCAALMNDNTIGLLAPNDNEAAMADMGDDQAIWNACWNQIALANQA